MMPTTETSKFEIVMAAITISFSAMIFTSAQSLPPPKFEPLGSAALPQILSVITVILSAAMLVRAFYNLRAPAEFEEQTDDGPVRRPLLALLVFVSTIAFVAVMDAGLLGFRIAGIIYLTGILFLMNHCDVKKLPWQFGFAAILVLVSNWVFTQFFYIDLP